MAEIPFEQFCGVIESTRGTAITTPTHMLSTPGTIKPQITRYRPVEARGTLVANYRTKAVRQWAEWECSGDVDVNYIAFWLYLFVKNAVTPTTPGGGTLSRLWTFTRAITADSLASATFTWFDPNLNMLRSPYCMGDELVIENDATGEGVATFSAKGMGQFPTKVTAPTIPASIAGDTLPGQMMQLWIDSASAIGTTAITGRLLKAKHTIKTGVTYKYVAAGPTASLSFTLTGRTAIESVTTELEFEMIDYTQYDLWAASTDLKVRVRHNGALIEGSLYNYLEVDQYGPFDNLDWGSNEDSNRTVKLTIHTQYDSTLASDMSVKVQNARTSL